MLFPRSSYNIADMAQSKRKQDELPSFDSCLASLKQTLRRQTAEMSVTTPVKVYTYQRDPMTGGVVAKKHCNRNHESVRRQETTERQETTTERQKTRIAPEIIQEGHGLQEDTDLALENLLSTIREAATSMAPKRTYPSWTERTTQEDSNWKRMRGTFLNNSVQQMAIHHNAICKICGSSDAVIRCRDCGSGVPVMLCSLCDQDTHMLNPFHNREIWTDGFFRYIPPTLTYQQEKLTETCRELPCLTPDLCEQCGSHQIKKTATRGKECIVITTSGRYDLWLPSYYCEACQSSMPGNQMNRIMSSNYWPGSPVHPHTFFSVEVFRQYNTLLRHDTSFSEGSYISLLADTSKHFARNPCINPSTFSKAFDEWRYCNSAVRSMQSIELLECPCCNTECHAVHCDGNQKLYRFSKVPRGTRKNYYTDEFVVDDEKVEEFVSNVYAKQSADGNSSCGDTKWKAAKSVSRRLANKDETGLQILGCRHQLALKSLNMTRGEVYAYSLYLQYTYCLPRHVKFFCQDVACKYNPWLGRVSMILMDIYPDIGRTMQMTPFLSLLHAKAHSWTCPIIFSGTWQTGAAGGAGEDVEQINSYLSKLNITTKNMCKAGREEHIIESVFHWNQRKRDNLALSLATRYKKAQSDVIETREALNNLKEVNQISNREIAEWLQELKHIAKDAASETNRKKTFEEKVELFTLHRLFCDHEHISSYLSQTSMGTAIMLKTTDLYEAAAEMDKELPRKRERLRCLKTKYEDNQNAMDDGFRLLVRKTLGDLQNKVELTQISINQRIQTIHRAADSSKKRTSLWQKVSAEKNELHRLVEKYNRLCDVCPGDMVHHQVTVDGVLKGDIPWLKQLSEDSFPIRFKKEVVECTLRIQRLIEEEALIKQEMINYINYWSMARRKNNAMLTNISRGEFKNTKDTQMYSLSEDNLADMTTSNGCIALLKEGNAFCKSQLAKGAELFTFALKDIVLPSSDSWSADDVDYDEEETS